MEHIKENKLNLIKNIVFFVFAGIIIFTGIYIRTHFFINNTTFSHDEALTSIKFFDTGLSGFFKSFQYCIKIPPLWGVIQKVILNIFGYSYITFRLFSYCISILSIIAFFILLKIILKNKLAILIGLILFVLNIPLIFFSANFKPYESDVLVCILLIMSYKYFSLKEITIKQSIIYSVISALLVLFSFPAMFIIPATVFAKSIEEKLFNYKSILILLSIIMCCLYLYLIDTDIYLLMKNYWANHEVGLINLSLSSFYTIFNELFHYVFCGYRVFWLITTICILGFLNFHIQKNNLRYLFLFIICLALSASIMKVYPFLGRIILYIIPIVIIYISSFIDYLLNLFKNNFLKRVFGIFVFFIIIFVQNIQTNDYTKYIVDLYIKNYDFYTIKQRTIIKNNALLVINKYKEGNILLSSSDMDIMVQLYKNLFYKNKNLKVRIFTLPTLPEIEDYIETILENKQKSEIIYFICEHRSYMLIPKVDFIEDLLKKQNLKYEKHIDEFMYIFKIYD